MVIIIRAHKIVKGFPDENGEYRMHTCCNIFKTVEYIQPEDVPFDINNSDEWLKYLINKGYHNLETNNDNKIGFRVYNTGDKLRTLFPGPGKDGKLRPIALYGVLADLIEDNVNDY